MELLQQLTQEQNQLGDMIAKLVANMKKDGPGRKVQRYIDEKRETLTKYWKEFENRHEEIKSLNIKEHRYFENKFYNQVSAAYNDGLHLLDKYQKNLCNKEIADKKTSSEQQTTASLSSEEMVKEDEATTSKSDRPKISSEEKLGETSSQYHLKTSEGDECAFNLNISTNNTEQKLRIRKQKTKINSLNRLLEDVIKNKDIPHPKMYYEYKRLMLNEHFNSITALHEEIIIYEEEYTDSYFNEEEYEQLEIKFQEVMILLHEKSCTQQSAEDEWTRLPRQTIPLFEGNYNNWTAFHDIFTRVIHQNKRICNAEKLQYLKTHLKGEAARLIKHLEISDANYLTAWNLINDRYNNKRALLFTQLEVLLNQPQQSMETSAGIKSIHDTTRECIHAIKNLGINTDTWGPIIVFTLVKKLDRETRKWYEQSVEKPKEIPDLNEFLKLLEVRFQSLENLKEQRRSYDVTKAPSHTKFTTRSFHSTKAQCNYCNGTHSIYNCKKFIANKVSERNQFIKNNKLCPNCMNHKEDTKCLSQQRCAVCKRFHHSLLHMNQNLVERNMGAQKPASSLVATAEEAKQKPNKETIASFNVKLSKHVLLATALVKVKTKALKGQPSDY